MPSPRIERIDFEGRPAWRKSYTVEPRTLRMSALRGIAWLLGIEPLRPPPAAPDARTACRTEQGMIRRLDALGARVPRILAAGDTELVLSHLGRNLSDSCKHEPTAAGRLRLLEQGFEALTDLHRRGGHASQAVARNLVVGERGVGFIDLEEDPLDVMSLPAAQARDLLLYVQSTARFATADAYRALLERALCDADRAVREQVVHVGGRLVWAASLSSLAGRRGRALASALRALARTALVALLWFALIEWSDEAVLIADLLLDDLLI